MFRLLVNFDADDDSKHADNLPVEALSGVRDGWKGWRRWVKWLCGGDSAFQLFLILLDILPKVST